MSDSLDELLSSDRAPTKRGTRIRQYARNLRGTVRIGIGHATLSLPYTLIYDQVAGIGWYDAKIDTLPGVRAKGRTRMLAKENIAIAAAHFIENCYRAARHRGWRPEPLPVGVTMRVPTLDQRTAALHGGVSEIHTSVTRKEVIQQAGYASGYLPGYPVRASAKARELPSEENGGTSALPPNESEV